MVGAPALTGEGCERAANNIKLDDMDEIADRCIAIISKTKTPPLTGVTRDQSVDELGVDSLDNSK